jgi:hypothetical protein
MTLMHVARGNLTENIVQRCVYPNDDETVRRKLKTRNNVVSPASLQSKYATSGVWLVSALAPSPLLPGVYAADTVPSAEYLGCYVNTQH